MTAEQQQKARFFAQYYGQKVCQYTNEISEVESITLHVMADHYYLILTPLSMVTEEHYQQVKRLEEATTIMEACSAIDFLRKNGYALDYDGIPVPEQVKRGWIKLRETTNG